MEFRFPHSVTYETRLDWSLDDVIGNLIAQKRLLEEGAAVLDLLIPGFEISKIEVLVKNVSSESPLLIEVVTQVYGAYQEQIQATVVGHIEKMMGVDIPKEYEALVTLATLALTYMIARWVYDKIAGKKKDVPASTHIEGSYNTVVNIIASKLDLSTGQVEDALHEA